VRLALPLSAVPLRDRSPHGPSDAEEKKKKKKKVEEEDEEEGGRWKKEVEEARSYRRRRVPVVRFFSPLFPALGSRSSSLYAERDQVQPS